ncbi:acyl-CoA dehydrogenase family protein [Mycobacterium kansasii]|uniref:Acyl-CoA dehydrogenase n=3 Tax=Mycobacterium kansasii TaxID=1768 RepID=A0A1V3XLN2_MYCKA|nr:acyl-CoA dehydrogenase family protein [Mycobacterium kansasii]EUA01551.1 acyl-CoA dehydrogenase, C-terminal domain protein [Mycobacterium kansasii 824]AGZ49730.1 acyl-CoA dehydrogenase [Mycobacterium kansasii ATCC 12478]ARG63877.1 acyl-CoA dehydrogenase [Mycobacterium kansasii]ARG71522.1 acyl-CoA dehydrogenase [Mycobacterium kansasii]ARG73963.1 acyl-CoA dehydrogenase [Mycobacterium kansasii]
MDFQLSHEQTLLRDTTRDLLSRSYDAESRNKVIGTELGWSREVWSQLADTGILSLGFDPAESGQIEIMVVMTEVGRRLAPEPVVHAALAPGALIAELGNDAQLQLLDDVAAGQLLLAFAHQEPGHRTPSADISTRAVRQGDSWLLSGHKNPVLAGDCADTLVVSAALPDGGVGLFLVDAETVTRHPYPTFDAHRGAQIDLDQTPGEPLGEAAEDASSAIRDAIIRIQSALCSEAVGAMSEALRLTTDYLKTRKQFGVTLNKFQALTQRAADMYVSLEMARSMDLYAAMSIADGNLDPLIASRAKLQVGRSARHIAQESIQLHGGIGMTAEYPVGHYAARLTAIEHTLGSAQDHLHVLIDHLGDYELVRL